MALPADVAKGTVTFGPYFDAGGAPQFAGLVGMLTPSTVVSHGSDGSVIVAAPITVTLDATGSASVVVARTTQTTTTPTSWTYTMTWQVGRFKLSPGSKTFAVTAAVVDYDLAPPVTPAPTPAVVGTAVVA